MTITSEPAELKVNISKHRNSNVELLRIVAMIMILMLHVNFISIGSPTAENCIANPVSSFLRIAFEQICIIAVNLFVLISGWFSIKVRTKGFLNFVFQCVFVLFIVYIGGVALGYTRLSVSGLLQCVCLDANGWFITSYVGLYIISPALNTFCEHAGEKKIRFFLIAFYVFQTIYDTRYSTATFFNAGYSAFSFIGLYVLARYARMYGQKFYKYGLALYLVSIILLISLYYFGTLLTLNHLVSLSVKYTSPFNVLASIGLVMWVASKPATYNRGVNFVARSAFAVYLCHSAINWTSHLYRQASQIIYRDFSGIEYLCIIGLFIACVFIASICVDQIRLWAWRLVSRFIP